MPIEIQRFGVGHRRPEGPAGTVGVQSQVIHSDARGVVSELAFARKAHVPPHSNPNTTYFIVIEGGGWVQVGEERARVAAGEAVLWPGGPAHAAWTEHSEMRALVVEFADADDVAVRGIVEGRAARLLGTGSVERAEGSLRPREGAAPDSTDRSSGEPL